MYKIRETIKNIGPLDIELMERAQHRLDNLTKPQGSLGRLEDVARLVVGITGKDEPRIKDKVIFTFAGDHGVTSEGVSAYPKEVTPQMVYNFLRGGAGINVLARHIGARVVVADFGVAQDLKPHPKLLIRKVNYGTGNIAKGPAMTKDEAVEAVERGIELFEREFRKGVDIAGTGEMGIGNTTPSTALAAVFTKRSVEELTGRGTGIDDAALANKIKIIKEALKINKPDAKKPMDVLAKVGGFEIAGLAGVVLAAASRRVPVVIDGFISGAAALVAYELKPKVKDYIIASHASQEKGHRAVLEYLGLEPLFDLRLRLGEGTGAALGIDIVDASLKILTQMATFESAKVSKRIKR